MYLLHTQNFKVTTTENLHRYKNREVNPNIILKTVTIEEVSKRELLQMGTINKMAIRI